MQDVSSSNVEHLFHGYLSMMHWSTYLCAVELVKSLKRKHSNANKCWFPEAWSSLARKTKYSQASIFCFWCSPPRILFNLGLLIIQGKKHSGLFHTDENSNTHSVSLWDKDFKGWTVSFWSLWLIHQNYLLQNNFKTDTEVYPESFRSYLKIKWK